MLFDKDKFMFKFLLINVVLLSACSSRVPKADLPSGANPQEELTRLNSDIMYGDLNNFSVLSAEDFNRAKLHQRKAEDHIKNNESRNKQLEELRIARGYLDRAKRSATENRSKVEPIVDARELAVNSGALQYPNTKAHIEEVDAEARKFAQGSDSPSPGEVQKIQQRYNDVHVETLETIHLSGVQNLLADAKRRNADSRAPETYKQAQVDYVNAKNALFVNRTNPSGYREAVKRAIWTSQTLSDVLDIADRSGNEFNESDAVRMVWQERQIQELKDQQNYRNLPTGETAAAEEGVDIQEVLETAKNEFDPQEAEVYEQDDKLLIRLKSIRFKQGSAEVPSRSTEVLAKVQDIIQDLKPASVVVQGHTDSTGNSDANLDLSQQRAEEVAQILKAQGMEEDALKVEAYGDSKPISSNKTAVGRAENRRIDILIVPEYAQR